MQKLDKYINKLKKGGYFPPPTAQNYLIYNGNNHVACRFNINDSILVSGYNVIIYPYRPNWDANDFSFKDIVATPPMRTNLNNMYGTIRHMTKNNGQCYYIIKLADGRWGFDITENMISPLNGLNPYSPLSPLPPNYPNLYQSPQSPIVIIQNKSDDDDNSILKNRNRNRYSDDDSEKFSIITLFNVSIYKSKVKKDEKVKDKKALKRELTEDLELKKELFLAEVYAKPADSIAKILDKVEGTYPNSRCIILTKNEYIKSLSPEDYNVKIGNLKIKTEDVNFFIIP